MLNSEFHKPEPGYLVSSSTKRPQASKRLLVGSGFVNPKPYGGLVFRPICLQDFGLTTMPVSVVVEEAWL